MSKLMIILGLLHVTLAFSPAYLAAQTTGKGTVDHSLWDDLLKKHVQADGLVDYQGLVADKDQLETYLLELANHHPAASWSKQQQMAYWINAYNAFTVKLIVDHYPIASIKDIKRGIPFVNTVWDIKFIELGDEVYDLNKIEHGILRKDFADARIHAAVNCASFSCPPLSNEAFVAERLEEQLDTAMRLFVNDTNRNKINAGKAELSAIFKWFSGDFKNDAGSVLAFVNRYAERKISAKTTIVYLDYDWSLNDVPK